MTQILIKNAKIVTPSIVIESGWLLTDNDKIKAFGIHDAPDFEVNERVDASGMTLLPGFIDIHCHGAVGHDFMSATPEQIGEIAQ
jgi:N-acetylglucosamine-6-phosphate deacetylase